MAISPPSAVLFLDIDGVLCCTRVHQAYRDPGLTWRRFDPVGVQFLNRLHDETACAVVVCSTWRKWTSREEMERLLRAAGWCGRLHEDWRTPDFNGNPRRGGEVRDWLDRHPEVVHWTALDDDSDYVPGDPLVVTDPHNGISFQAYSLARAHLTGEEPPPRLDASLARASWPGIPGRPYGTDQEIARLLAVIHDLETRLARTEGAGPGAQDMTNN